MTGTIGILSVGAGDTTLSFDKNNPAELERAKRVVTDMLKRGYALLIQVGEQDGEPIYRRAKAFDPETCEYVIAGAPPDEQEEKAAPARSPARAKVRKTKEHRVDASKARAVAVGRIAGG